MLQQLIGPVSGLLDKFIEDKDQKAKLAHEIGISGNAIAKRYRKFSILKPARGFLAKVAIGKILNPIGVLVRQS